MKKTEIMLNKLKNSYFNLLPDITFKIIDFQKDILNVKKYMLCCPYCYYKPEIKIAISDNDYVYKAICEQCGEDTNYFDTEIEAIIEWHEHILSVFYYRLS